MTGSRGRRARPVPLLRLAYQTRKALRDSRVRSTAKPPLESKRPRRMTGAGRDVIYAKNLWSVACNSGESDPRSVYGCMRCFATARK